MVIKRIVLATAVYLGLAACGSDGDSDAVSAPVACIEQADTRCGADNDCFNGYRQWCQSLWGIDGSIDLDQHTACLEALADQSDQPWDWNTPRICWP